MIDSFSGKGQEAEAAAEAEAEPSKPKVQKGTDLRSCIMTISFVQFCVTSLLNWQCGKQVLQVQGDWPQGGTVTNCFQSLEREPWIYGDWNLGLPKPEIAPAPGA